MNQLSKIITSCNDAIYNRNSGESIIDWAERNIILSSAHGDSGPLRLGGSRYLHEPLLAFADREIRELVILKPTQTGGSLVAEIALNWQMVNRPGSIQWFAYTDTKAEEQMLSRLKPVMMNNKTLAPLLPNDDRKIRADGVRIPGCEFVITGHSEADLQSSTRHLVIVDELAHYDEGTVLYQIKARTGYTAEKGNSKMLVVSQAGFVGNEMDLAYKNGTQEEWMVPCEACKNLIAPQIIHFTAGGLSFGDESLGLKDEKGKYILGKIEKVLTFTCPHCNHHHKDSPRLKNYWNENGKYVAQNQNSLSGHRSFHWTAIHCRKWIDLINDWLTVCDIKKRGLGRKEFEEFFHKQMAKSLDPDEYLNSDKVVRTDKPYDKSGWADEFTRNLVLDVQKDKFFGNVRAYSKDGRSRQLWCGWLDTIEQVLNVQSEFNIPFSMDKTGKKTYSVIWDSGYPVRQSEIYTYCIKYNHLAIKGDTSGTKQFDRWINVGGKKVNKPTCWTISPTRGDPLIGQKGAGKGPSCPLVIFATDSLKKTLVQLRDGKGPEWLCLSREENPAFDDYNKGIFNEEFYTHDVRTGRPIKGGKWEKINKSVTNEAFDVEAYSIGAAIMAGVEFDLYGNLPSNEYLKAKTQSAPIDNTF